MYIRRGLKTHRVRHVLEGLYASSLKLRVIAITLCCARAHISLLRPCGAFIPAGTSYLVNIAATVTMRKRSKKKSQEREGRLRLSYAELATIY